MSVTPKQGLPMARSVAPARWPYDIHSYVEVAPLLDAGLSRARPVPARPWDHRFSRPTRRAMDNRPRWRRCRVASWMRSKSSGGGWRIRLGRTDRRHRRGALARARRVARLGQWLSDRQPEGRARRRFRPKRSCSGGTSSISRPIADARATRVPARFREADLETRVAEMGVRRGDVHRSAEVVRQSRSCRRS